MRGTTADPDGNITMEREALTLEALAIAMAARNSGGIVIVQVERIAERGSLNPRHVKIPGVLVDCIVVAEKPEYHMQTFVEQYNPGFSGEIRVPVSSLAPMPMSERKIIARRAAFELQANSVVNLGIGMPEGVSAVAAEEKVIDLLTSDGRTRSGRRHSGVGSSTSARQSTRRRSSTSPISSTSTTAADSISPSSAWPRPTARAISTSASSDRALAGAGGFINISQSAKRVVFVGTFTAGDLQVRVEDGRLAVA